MMCELSHNERERLVRLYELQDWDLDIVFCDTRLADAYGSADPNATTKHSRIEIYTDAHDGTPEDPIETLAHELCETYLHGQIFHALKDLRHLDHAVDLAADYVRRVAKRAYEMGKQSRGKK